MPYHPIQIPSEEAVRTRLRALDRESLDTELTRLEEVVAHRRNPVEVEAVWWRGETHDCFSDQFRRALALRRQMIKRLRAGT